MNMKKGQRTKMILKVQIKKSMVMELKLQLKK